jgi:hypothetical protein
MTRDRQGRDDEYGYGVLNIVKALTADVPPLASASPTGDVVRATPGRRQRRVGSSARRFVLAGVVLLLIAGTGLVLALRRRA